jgi:hypothetical protein
MATQSELNKWNLSNVSITYPSLNDNLSNKTNTNTEIDKYYAIDTIKFTWKNYCLELSFDFNYMKTYMFFLLDYTNKQNPVEIAEGKFDTLDVLEQILTKLSLPKIDKELFTTFDTKYFLTANDDDYNNNNETNINSIKLGDYGYPLSYRSKYMMSDFDSDSAYNLHYNVEETKSEYASSEYASSEYASNNKLIADEFTVIILADIKKIINNKIKKLI